MNKRIEEAAKDYLFFVGLAPGGECGDAFLAGARWMNEECAKLFESESCLDHENEFCVGARIRALVADEEKSG